ncbi:MAG: hypothetical protein Q8916_01235 [Bacteroidota bacterium]|nr:hypothetical protein [Bacteroidota bacterium]MDP4236008.1 hypothetical protein [Bacteroidota bacterium]
MSVRPIHSQGILRLTDSRSWLIELQEPHPSMEDGMPVEMVLWDARNEGSRSEVEEISRIQQLEPAIVALALAVEGTLAQTDFGKRVVGYC